MSSVNFLSKSYKNHSVAKDATNCHLSNPTLCICNYSSTIVEADRQCFPYMLYWSFFFLGWTLMPSPNPQDVSNIGNEYFFSQLHVHKWSNLVVHSIPVNNMTQTEGLEIAQSALMTVNDFFRYSNFCFSLRLVLSE